MAIWNVLKMKRYSKYVQQNYVLINKGPLILHRRPQ